MPHLKIILQYFNPLATVLMGPIKFSFN